MIDIHQIMLISLFPTPFDHFHFHRSGGLILWYDLRLWLTHLLTHSLTDNLKSRDASASKKKSSQRKESCKTKRADDRMHKISFHADKICHTGKYGKQPNTKYQMFSEQIISYFSSRKQVTLSSKYDSAHLKIVQNALIH